MSAPEAQPGKYVYALIRSGSGGNPHTFGTRGIGERGDVVHTINHRGLSAVVSDTPVIEYDSSRRNMMAHTLVLEEIMKECGALLPVRFGTVAPKGAAGVERILESRYSEFSGLLDEMTGLVELGLKAFWYEEVVFQELVEKNGLIRQLRDKLTGRTVEETYYERIQFGELIENAMWKKRDEDAELILEQLRPLVDRTRANKVITDRMVLNAAFLVKESRQPEFDAMVKKLDELMGKRMMFKYVGPVAPYNFVNVVVSWKD